MDVFLLNELYVHWRLVLDGDFRTWRLTGIQIVVLVTYSGTTWTRIYLASAYSSYDFVVVVVEN